MVFINRIGSRMGSVRSLMSRTDEEGDDMVSYLESATGLDLDGDGEAGKAPKHWRQQGKVALRNKNFSQNSTAPKVGESACVLRLLVRKLPGAEHAHARVRPVRPCC